jgi:hypothetical protein
MMRDRTPGGSDDGDDSRPWTAPGRLFFGESSYIFLLERRPSQNDARPGTMPVLERRTSRECRIRAPFPLQIFEGPIHRLANEANPGSRAYRGPASRRAPPRPGRARAAGLGASEYEDIRSSYRPEHGTGKTSIVDRHSLVRQDSNKFLTRAAPEPGVAT